MSPLTPTGLPPIAGYHPTTLLDWPGRLAAIVFLPRCNFRCPFCHAGHLLGDPAETVPLEAVLAHLADREGWLDGVVVCGGEPTLWPTLGDLCRRFRDAGLPVKLDTNGTRPDVLAALLDAGLVDAVAMDVKAPLDARYARAAGVEAADLQTLRRSIALLMASTAEVEFRTTVVPTLLAEAEIQAIGETLAAAAASGATPPTARPVRDAPGATGGLSASAVAIPGRPVRAAPIPVARGVSAPPALAPIGARPHDLAKGLCGTEKGSGKGAGMAGTGMGAGMRAGTGAGTAVWTLQPFEPAGALDPAFRTVAPYPPDRLAAMADLGRRYVSRCRLRGESGADGRTHGG
ncbi:MAG: anaerobic ribonucleoside-triphosphate reductase activating protein [Planctomycetes bacterium]|nr:anaerobic ribonucleoside-triphosphate reductase activating protein [Planctomycetota bacterium]